MGNLMIHTPTYFDTTRHVEYWQTSNNIRVLSNAYAGSNGGASGTLRFPGVSATGFTAGFNFRWVGSTGGTASIFGLFEGSVLHCDLRFNATTGQWTVTRNATVLLTSTTVLAPDTDYYIEIQFVIHDTTGVAILKIDGSTDSVINSSVLDTRNANTGVANAVEYELHSTGVDTRISHMYLNDNTGGADDTFWGPIVVASQIVSGAGAHAEWTPLSSTNASNVDEAAADGDTTYNATSTLNELDTFAVSSTGYSAGTVKGVEWAAELRRTDASSTARIAPVYRVSGTDYVGSNITHQSDYRIRTERKRLNPDTSAAWTVAQLNSSTEIGYKRTAL